MDIFEQQGEQQINYQSGANNNGTFPTQNNGVSVNSSTQFQTFNSAASANLAPLPESLQRPQRGYPNTASMMEFIGEASVNTPVNSWNAFPFAPNENLNQLQNNGMLVEPRMSNPLLGPNIIENNNYNGINHQFPYPLLSQPNLVGAMPGFTTGQSSGHFFTNQRSDFVSLQDPVTNSQTTWNSRLPRTQPFSTMLPQTQTQAFSTLLPQTQAFSTMLPQTQTQAFSTLQPQTQAFSTMLPQTQAFPTMPHQTNYTSENPLRIFDLQSQNSIQHPVNPNSRLDYYPYHQHTSAPVLTNPNVHHNGYGPMLPASAAPSALPNPMYSNFGVQGSVFGTGSSSFSSVVSPAIPSLHDEPTVNNYSQASLPLGHGQRDVTSVQRLLRSQSMPNNEIAQNSESQNATFRGSFNITSCQAQGSEIQNLPGTGLTEGAPSEHSKKDEVAQLLRLVREKEKSQQEVAPTPTKGVQGKGKSRATSSSTRKPTVAVQRILNMGSNRRIIREGHTNVANADEHANKVRKVSSEPEKTGTMSGDQEHTNPENVEKEDQNILPTLAPMSNSVYLRNADGVNVHPDPYVRAMIAQGWIVPNPREEEEEEEVSTVKSQEELK